MVIRGSPPIWSGNRIDDVVDPGCSEGLGFRQGRYRCRAGAVGQHEPGDVDGFHGLQMRPQIDARGLDVLREPADVVEHSALIEQQCRGREVGEAWIGGAQNQTRARIGRMLARLVPGAGSAGRRSARLAARSGRIHPPDALRNVDHVERPVRSDDEPDRRHCISLEFLDDSGLGIK